MIFCLFLRNFVKSVFNICSGFLGMGNLNVWSVFVLFISILVLIRCVNDFLVIILVSSIFLIIDVIVEYIFYIVEKIVYWMLYLNWLGWCWIG